MGNIYVMYADLYETDAEEIEKINGVYKDNSTNFLIIGEETLSVVQNVLKSFSEKYEDNDIGEWLYENGIEGYIKVKYESKEFNFFGASFAYYEFSEAAANFFRDNGFTNLEKWYDEVNNVLKKRILNYVNRILQDQLEELKEDGFEIDMLELKCE